MKDQLIAIAFAVLGCLFSALALVLMKHAHNQSTPGSKIIFVNSFWNLGFFILIVGSIFNIVAIGYGNIIMLAATSSLSIIFNTIFAINFLGERLHAKRVLGIVLICIGSSLFLSLAKNDSKKYTEMDLFKLFGRIEAISYFLGSMLCIILVYCFDHKTKLSIKAYFAKR